jgi:hypothetical protein
MGISSARKNVRSVDKMPTLFNRPRCRSLDGENYLYDRGKCANAEEVDRVNLLILMLDLTPYIGANTGI